MTRAELERAVRAWQRLLGLEHWQIDVVWDASRFDNEDVDDNSAPVRQAFTWRPRDYDFARLYLNPATCHDWPARDAHAVIVHELLHLATREVEWILDLVEGQLHRDVDELVHRTLRHVVEGFVDRIANRIVDLAADPAASPLTTGTTRRRAGRQRSNRGLESGAR